MEEPVSVQAVNNTLTNTENTSHKIYINKYKKYVTKDYFHIVLLHIYNKGKNVDGKNRDKMMLMPEKSEFIAGLCGIRQFFHREYILILVYH